MQVINTNIQSLNAQRNLSTSGNALSTALERLSSGLRINSAKDDAAGLAIATRFTTQINGLNQAVRNANDGVSLSQTAESALQELTNNLQRVRELGVQSANATNSASDRAALDQEVQQRIAEIDRIASQTSFNGLKVLDGSFGNAQFQVGANVGETIGVNLSTGVRAGQIGQLASVTTGDLSANFASVATAASLTGSVPTTRDFSQTVSAATLTGIAGSAADADFSGVGNDRTFDVNGTTVTLNTDLSAAGDLVAAVQTQLGGAFAVSDVGGALQISTVATGAASNITIDGADAAQFFGAATQTDAGTDSTAASFQVNGNTVTLNTNLSAAGALGAAVQAQLGAGFTVTESAGALQIADASGTTGTGSTITITNETGTDLFGTTSAAGSAAVAGATLAAGDFTLQSGTDAAVDITGTFANAADLANAINTSAAGGAGKVVAVASSDGTSIALTSGTDFTIGGANVPAGFTAATTAVTGSLNTVNVGTVASANDAIQRADTALSAVSTLRSSLGAIQNRFESTISNLQAVSQNLSASRSRIQDADFAAETAALSRAQILQQAGVTVLTQANAAPQAVLQLLR
jgi:flagellin